MSYTRTREIVLQAFAELGYPKHLFGLHSLRAGGASAAANVGVSDPLFTADGGLIGPKMAILRLVWNHYFQCQKVCMLSFSLFSFFIFEAGINKRDARP